VLQADFASGFWKRRRWRQFFQPLEMDAFIVNFNFGNPCFPALLGLLFVAPLDFVYGMYWGGGAIPV